MSGDNGGNGDNPRFIGSKWDTAEIKDKLLGYIAGHERPTIYGFSYNQMIPRSYLYRLAKRDPELGHIIEILQSKQIQCLLEKGLKGDYVASVVNLVLMNEGFKERQELGIKDESETPPPSKMAIDYIKTRQQQEVKNRINEN